MACRSWGRELKSIEVFLLRAIELNSAFFCILVAVSWDWRTLFFCPLFQYPEVTVGAKHINLMVGTEVKWSGVWSDAGHIRMLVSIRPWLLYVLLFCQFSFTALAENTKKWSAARSSSWCPWILLTLDMKNQADKSPCHFWEDSVNF